MVKKPTLKDLAKALLGRDIQKGKHHDPCEDAYASLQLYLQKFNSHLFEEAKRKPKGRAHLDIDFDDDDDETSGFDFGNEYDDLDSDEQCWGLPWFSLG